MITSFLQLLDRRYSSQLDSDAREFIDFAVDGAKRLDKMIIDLREYSRIANKEMMFSHPHFSNSHLVLPLEQKSNSSLVFKHSL